MARKNLKVNFGPLVRERVGPLGSDGHVRGFVEVVPEECGEAGLFIQHFECKMKNFLGAVATSSSLRVILMVLFSNNFFDSLISDQGNMSDAESWIYSVIKNANFFILYNLRFNR
jgi:hypothetical protein